MRHGVSEVLQEILGEVFGAVELTERVPDASRQCLVGVVLHEVADEPAMELVAPDLLYAKRRLTLLQVPPRKLLAEDVALLRTLVQPREVPLLWIDRTRDGTWHLLGVFLD